VRANLELFGIDPDSVPVDDGSPRPTHHEVSSSYRQFYVADAELDPDAPEDWSDEHVRQRFNALEHIVALCPVNDFEAQVTCVPPGQSYTMEGSLDFEVRTRVSIPSGRLGVFGWPREPLVIYDVEPGTYGIRFRGYDTHLVDIDEDLYVVEFERLEESE